MATSTIPNYRSGLVKANGANELFYEENTTRNGAGTAFNPNPSFLSSGYLSISKVGKQVVVHVCGYSSKTAQDWMGYFKAGYRPYWAKESFRYMLGDSEYTGWIQGDTASSNKGYIFFSTLNQTDLLSATISFNLP